MERKNFIRLVHPITNDFIGEFYPDSNCIIVVRRKRTALIDLNKIKEEYEQQTKRQETVNND